MKKQKTTDLILDIRGNEGGQDEILLYLGQQIAKTTLSSLIVKNSYAIRWFLIAFDPMFLLGTNPITI